MDAPDMDPRVAATKADALMNLPEPPQRQELETIISDLVLIVSLMTTLKQRLSRGLGVDPNGWFYAPALAKAMWGTRGDLPLQNSVCHSALWGTPHASDEQHCLGELIPVLASRCTQAERRVILDMREIWKQSDVVWQAQNPKNYQEFAEEQSDFIELIMFLLHTIRAHVVSIPAFSASEKAPRLQALTHARDEIESKIRKLTNGFWLGNKLGAGLDSSNRSPYVRATPPLLAEISAALKLTYH